MQEARPTEGHRVYVRFEDQVEVYDPDPKEALAVALSPDLQPAPAG